MRIKEILIGLIPAGVVAGGGPLTFSNGIYHPCRVDVRGAK